ncbi:MAG: tetratricopeptide repeat protein [Paracoccaceae bacterium]|nr:tetratricopeptide repeat protein [Paracoccaceae bacterium]
MAGAGSGPTGCFCRRRPAFPPWRRCRGPIVSGWSAAGAVLILGLVAGPFPGTASRAQTDDPIPREQTLADIRQELEFLVSEIQSMRTQLSTTGEAPEHQSETAAPMMIRLDAIEEEIRTLTGAVESLMFQVESVVADGTRRIGDLEYRLVELEGGDVSQLGQTTTLGSTSPAAAAGTGTASGLGDESVANSEGAETGTVAMTDDSATVASTTVVDSDPADATTGIPGETDFERGLNAFAARDHEAAIRYLDSFTTSNPDDPRFSEARYWQGESHMALGDWVPAAQAFLSSFNRSQDGPVAPLVVLGLGASLGRLGQDGDACRILSQVSVRYPDATDAAERADIEMARNNCE